MWIKYKMEIKEKMQMRKIEPETWKEDLAEFREKTHQFYAGEMDKGDYKGFSGGFGSYAQR